MPGTSKINVMVYEWFIIISYMEIHLKKFFKKHPMLKGRSISNSEQESGLDRVSLEERKEVLLVAYVLKIFLDTAGLLVLHLWF